MLAPFRVLDDASMGPGAVLTFLDAPAEARLVRDADELLFLVAARLDPPTAEARRGSSSATGP